MLRPLFIFLWVAFVGIALTSDLTYRAIQQVCSRPLLSDKTIIKIKAKRDRLIQEHETEEINICTSDGLNLSGLLVKRKDAKQTVLACHGYRLGKESMIYCVNVFPDAHILLLDFRTHGESEGELTTGGFNEIQDVKAAVNYLRKNQLTTKLPLVAIGFSMGSVSLLGALSQGVHFDAVILDSCFADLGVQLGRYLNKFYNIPDISIPAIRHCFSLFAGVNLNAVSPVKWIQDAQVPFLIIHSRDDEVAFQQDARKLHAVAQCSELWLVDGSGHGSIWKDYPQEYREKISDFIRDQVN